MSTVSPSSSACSRLQPFAKASNGRPLPFASQVDVARCQHVTRVVQNEAFVHPKHVYLRSRYLSRIHRMPYVPPRSQPFDPPPTDLSAGPVGRALSTRRTVVPRIEAGVVEGTVHRVSIGISIHYLRHIFATTAAMHGVPMPVIARLLGHSTIREKLFCD